MEQTGTGHSFATRLSDSTGLRVNQSVPLHRRSPIVHHVLADRFPVIRLTNFLRSRKHGKPGPETVVKIRTRIQKTARVFFSIGKTAKSARQP